MVLSLQSRATHRRNRGVILRLARESELKMQEACQFNPALEYATILSQVKTEKPETKGASLTGLAHIRGTRADLTD
jgi:hypothetical protein